MARWKFDSTMVAKDFSSSSTCSTKIWISCAANPCTTCNGVMPAAGHVRSWKRRSVCVILEPHAVDVHARACLLGGRIVVDSAREREGHEAVFRAPRKLVEFVDERAEFPLR